MVFNETEYVYNATSGDLWLIVYNITVPSQEVIPYNTTYAVCVDNYDFNASKKLAFMAFLYDEILRFTSAFPKVQGSHTGL